MRATVLCLLLLAGCATKPDVVVMPVPVEVPVPVLCAIDPGPRPPQPDTNEAIQAAPNVAGRVDLVLAGTLAREDWIARLEAANAGCRKP